MLISEKTSLALDELVGAYFDLNRSFDRAVSILQNKFSMPNAAIIIHHKLAHLFPLMADKVTEIKDLYNLETIYPETHRDSRDYMDLKNMMDTLLKEVSDCYSIIKLVNEVATENKDYNVQAELVRLMNYHSLIMGQVITLRDKAEQMPTDFDNYDRHIDSWGIVGIPEIE